MIVLLSVFKVLVPMAYLVVWGLYLWLFIADHPTARRLCSRFALGTVVLHVAALVVKGVTMGRLPMAGPLEFSCALAAAMLLTYLAIDRGDVVELSQVAGVVRAWREALCLSNDERDAPAPAPPAPAPAPAPAPPPPPPHTGETESQARGVKNVTEQRAWARPIPLLKCVRELSAADREVISSDTDGPAHSA